jgi:protein disulfide-isomerase
MVMTRIAFVAVFVGLGCNGSPTQTTAPTKIDDAKEPASVVVASPEPESDPEPEPEGELEVPKEKITILSIDPVAGELADQLLVEAGKAKKAGKSAYVELWAGWCPPCKKVDALLEDPALQERLGGVVLIRVDTDTFNKPLTRLGFKSPTIPAFYEIDARGKPTKRLLHGHSWKNTATIAEKLPEFLLGGQ